MQSPVRKRKPGSRSTRRGRWKPAQRNGVGYEDMHQEILVPHKVLTPRDASKLRLMYYEVYHEYQRRTAESSRGLLEESKARYLEAEGYPELRCAHVKGIVTGWKWDRNDDGPEGRLWSICLSTPETEVEFDDGWRGWMAFDSHIWLALADMRLDEPIAEAGAVGKADLRVQLGDTLKLAAALKTYKGSHCPSRMGVGLWFPESSELMYAVRSGSKMRKHAVPPQLSRDAMLVEATNGCWRSTTRSEFDASVDALSEKAGEMSGEVGIVTGGM